MKYTFTIYDFILAFLLIGILLRYTLQLVKNRKGTSIKNDNKKTVIVLISFGIHTLLYGVNEYVELRAELLEEANDPDYHEFNQDYPKEPIPPQIQEIKSMLKVGTTTKQQVREKIGSPTYVRSRFNWAYSLGKSESYDRLDKYYESLIDEKLQIQMFLLWRNENQLYAYTILWAEDGQVKLLDSSKNKKEI